MADAEFGDIGAAPPSPAQRRSPCGTAAGRWRDGTGEAGRFVTVKPRPSSSMAAFARDSGPPGARMASTLRRQLAGASSDGQCPGPGRLACSVLPRMSSSCSASHHRRGLREITERLFDRRFLRHGAGHGQPLAGQGSREFGEIGNAFGAFGGGPLGGVVAERLAQAGVEALPPSGEGRPVSCVATAARALRG